MESPTPVSLTFNSLTYDVPPPPPPFPKSLLPFLNKSSPHTRILHSISGHIPAGSSLAILGPSGSGKTSLLNLLAARTPVPPVEGQVLFNSQPRVARTKRSLGYVMQDDVFFSRLTVRETLDFTARIRLPSSLSAKHREQKVDEVLRRLRLVKCQHTRIGDQQFDKGISGGERKRVNIANELLHDPAVLLADEPTSGLDSSSATTVVSLLNELSAEGRTVVATIHQPSSQMFAMFNQIMVLAAGRVAYFGTAENVAAYFGGIGMPFPNTMYNPADYLLELVIDDEEKEGQPSTQKKILDAWEVEEGRLTENTDQYPFGVRVRQEPSQVVVVVEESDQTGFGETDGSDETATEVSLGKVNGMQELFDPPGPSTVLGRIARACEKRWWDITGQHGKYGEKDKWANGWWRQVLVLGIRTLRQKRGNLLEPVYVFQVLAVTALCLLVWFQMDASETSIEDRLGFLSFSSIFWAFYSTFSALFTFPAEKQVLNKDRAGGAYRLSAYYFAKALIEMPADMLYPTFFSIVTYFAADLNPYFPSFVLSTITLVLNVLAAQGVGLLISALLMDVRQAQVLASLTILSSMLLSGYYVNPDNIPSFADPFRYVSFIKYSYETMVRIEMLNGQTFECVGAGTEYSIQDDGERLCPIDGERVLKGAQINDSLSIPLGMLVLVGWIVVTRVLGYFALKFGHTGHKPKRKSS